MGQKTTSEVDDTLDSIESQHPTNLMCFDSIHQIFVGNILYIGGNNGTGSQ